MNEKQTDSQPMLPSKKQRELLSYIETFITEHGYSPSYREIMSGQGYSSVATVALHVNNLIKRGQLRKRDRSARSLELVTKPGPAKVTSNQITPNEEKWLVEKVEHAFTQAESIGNEYLEDAMSSLHTLIAALKVLGMEGAAQSFVPRLSALKSKQKLQ
jgi:SOS-response transcriptional repressor LexA